MVHAHIYRFFSRGDRSGKIDKYYAEVYTVLLSKNICV